MDGENRVVWINCKNQWWFKLYGPSSKIGFEVWILKAWIAVKENDIFESIIDW